jgi:pimeloyl-ACP methyl ester carboxylesterase
MTTSSAVTGNDSTTPGPKPAARASRLADDRTGRGEPLVLLHGQGFSRRCWDPIVDSLAAERDVIAVDLPGHGDSPRQRKGTGSAPHDLAVAVAEAAVTLGTLGLQTRRPEPHPTSQKRQKVRARVPRAGRRRHGGTLRHGPVVIDTGRQAQERVTGC